MNMTLAVVRVRSALWSTEHSADVTFHVRMSLWNEVPAHNEIASGDRVVENALYPLSAYRHTAITTNASTAQTSSNGINPPSGSTLTPSAAKTKGFAMAVAT